MSGPLAKPWAMACFLLMAGCAEVKQPLIVPGETIASRMLKRDAAESILSTDQKSSPGCGQRWIAQTKLYSSPGADQTWVEGWFVYRCGDIIKYEVTFRPREDPDFVVRPAKRN